MVHDAKLVQFFLIFSAGPPRVALFPYTTLFRSEVGIHEVVQAHSGASSDFTGQHGPPVGGSCCPRSEEHTSELQSLTNLVCRLLLVKKKKKRNVRRISSESTLRQRRRYEIIRRT